MHLSPHYRFGQAPDTAITERDPRSLDRKELEEYAEYARDGYVEIYNIARQLEQRNVELKKEYTRVLSFSSCLSSNSEFPRTWIRGHIDSPNETSSWMCFGERIKHPVVVVFSPGGSLKTASKHQLMEEKARGIYFRLPTHRATTLYVSQTASTKDSSREYWLSTKERTQPGYMQRWTIHLKRLGLTSRVRLWTGQTRWLFIAFEDNATEKPTLPLPPRSNKVAPKRFQP